MGEPAVPAGREPALRICRGVARWFRDQGLVSLFEVPLPNGRRADVLALDGAGQLLLVEVKASVADFRSDRKWPDYLDYCDAFWFAVAADFPAELIPEPAGLLVADAWGAHALRNPAARPPLAAARRRALLLRFAHLAAGRLQGLLDPPPGS